MKTVVEDRGLHIVWMIIDVLIGMYTQDKVISGDRPNVLGDRPDMRGPLSCLDIWNEDKMPTVSFKPRMNL